MPGIAERLKAAAKGALEKTKKFTVDQGTDDPASAAAMYAGRKVGEGAAHAMDAASLATRKAYALSGKYSDVDYRMAASEAFERAPEAGQAASNWIKEKYRAVHNLGKNVGTYGQATGVVPEKVARLVPESRPYEKSTGELFMPVAKKMEEALPTSAKQWKKEKVLDAQIQQLYDQLSQAPVEGGELMVGKRPVDQAAQQWLAKQQAEAAKQARSEAILRSLTKKN